MTEHDIACKIHDAAIGLLNDPGIKLDHDEIWDTIWDYLTDIGCVNILDSHIVPAHESLEKFPPIKR